MKKKFSKIVTLSFLGLGTLAIACKSTQPVSSTGISSTATPQKPAENLGFYQFSNEDPTASPFVAKKASVYGKNGMVAATHPVASQVGVDILKMGGNAMDAAVATQFALAVVHPAAGNIAGGGFMVIRDKKGNAYTLDYREKAPEKADKDMYLDADKNVKAGQPSLFGHLASGTPGSVDGLEQAHKRFGKLTWQQVLQPAIDLAEKGVALTAREARGLNRTKADFITYNPTKRYYMKPDTSDWKEGELLVQPDLAKTLRRIQLEGRKGFYEGETARLLLEEMKRGGGIITQHDLDTYKAVWRTPVTGTYKNMKIISMPPPSSGGIALLQLLKMLEPYPLTRWGWHSDSTVQVMIEAERRVYADRAKWLGDPDFIKVPQKELLEADYLKKRWEDFSFDHATDSKNIKGGAIPSYESLETTHSSFVDKEGNAVSITTTLNGSYGSKVIVDGAGFLMNNEMDDFSIKTGVPNVYGLIGSEANAIAANKRMLSSMTPTIVEQDGKLKMVLGTPGGSTIITSVFQVFLNVVEHGMTMQQAVDALRFHHQWIPDRTTFEEGGFTEPTLKRLRDKGYKIDGQKNTIGRMDCILVLPDGTYEGGADVRADDTAVGY